MIDVYIRVVSSSTRGTGTILVVGWIYKYRNQNKSLSVVRIVVCQSFRMSHRELLLSLCFL